MIKPGAQAPGTVGAAIEPRRGERGSETPPWETLSPLRGSNSLSHVNPGLTLLRIRRTFEFVVRIRSSNLHFAFCNLHFEIAPASGAFSHWPVCRDRVNSSFMLRAHAKINWHFGGSFGRADARRRDAGDVSAHRRGAGTKQMPARSPAPRAAVPQQNAKLFLRGPLLSCVQKTIGRTKWLLQIRRELVVLARFI